MRVLKKISFNILSKNLLKGATAQKVSKTAIPMKIIVENTTTIKPRF
jgi:hypothetical protein